jgi:hypothetical protein
VELAVAAVETLLAAPRGMEETAFQAVAEGPMTGLQEFQLEVMEEMD